MTFKTGLDTDMEGVFLNTDEFAEDVVYTPRAGAARTIPAIVDRDQIKTRPEDQGRVAHKTAEIIIHNDAANGVTSVNNKGDSVSFAPREGQDAVDWDVIRILESSDAHWRLEVSR